MTITSNLKGVLLSLLAFSGYSLMDGFIKYVLSVYEVSWQQLLLYIAVIVTTVLFFLLLLGKKQTFVVKNPFWFGIRSALGIASLNLVIIALPMIDLDLYYALVFLLPIVASTLAIFFLNERLNIHKIVGILGGFVGILVITRPWEVMQNQHIPLLAVAIVLVCVFCDSGIGIIARKYLIAENPITLVFYQFIFITLIAAASVVYKHQAITLPNIKLMLPILIICVFALVGYICYIKAVQTAPVQIVLPVSYCQMIIGIFLGIVLFHQFPNLNTILGAVIIIIASLYITLYASFTKAKRAKKKWNDALYVINQLKNKFKSWYYNRR